MRRVVRYTLMATMLTGMTVGLSDCQQKELCFHPEEHVKSHVLNISSAYDHSWEYNYGGPDWPAEWDSSYFGYDYNDLLLPYPSGIRALVYNDNEPYTLFNIDTNGGRVYMSPGYHDIILYNNDTYYVEFNDLGESAAATVTTRTRSRSTYLGSSAFTTKADEVTVNPPDMLYGAFIEQHDGTNKFEEAFREITMHPLVFRYLIRWEFSHGLEYVGLGRGALAGVAQKVYLTDGRSGNERATVLFDCVVNPWGVEAIVNTFGAPGYPNEHYNGSRAELRYGLNLEVRLKNGKILTYDFDITDQMELQPRGGVIVVSGLEVPDKDGKEHASGAFNIEVEGWGENEDIDIPF